MFSSRRPTFLPHGLKAPAYPVDLSGGCGRIVVVLVMLVILAEKNKIPVKHSVSPGFLL